MSNRWLLFLETEGEDKAARQRIENELVAKAAQLSAVRGEMKDVRIGGPVCVVPPRAMIADLMDHGGLFSQQNKSTIL